MLIFFSRTVLTNVGKKMRLIHNMTTIAECPAPEHSVSKRVIKMAVIGGSGVGKTGKKTTKSLEF